MSSNIVGIAGCNVAQEADGTYRVRVFYTLSGGRMQEEETIGLTWTEATDCIITQLDNVRPGWAVGDGWRQPDLWEELDAPWGGAGDRS